MGYPSAFSPTLLLHPPGLLQPRITRHTQNHPDQAWGRYPILRMWGPRL